MDNFSPDSNASFREQISEFGDHLYNIGYRGDTYRLARRTLRKRLQINGKILPIYIVVQGATRYKYSHAEGGCWADWYRTIEVRRAWDWKSATEMIRELKSDYPKPRHNRYSAIGGEDIIFTITHSVDEFPKDTTEAAIYC